jgi:hypothetical protein
MATKEQRIARFHTKLIMTPVAGRRMWILEAPLVYESVVLDTIVAVPAGFICDLNSIPRIFWWLSPPTDFPEAGVVHDFGYRYKLWPRETVDAVYREALDVTGAGAVRRFLRYWGVRIGGSSAYKKPADEAR